MKGSEKQIKWAQEIIESQKDVIAKHLRNNRDRVAHDGEKFPNLVLMLAAQEVCCKLVAEGLDKLDDARTIIDNRNTRYLVLKQILPTLQGEAKETVMKYFTAMQGKVNTNDMLGILVG